MNLTDMKCALKFLGWENRVKARESLWVDTQNNRLIFSDYEITLRINNNLTRYPNIGTDMQIIMDKIMETVKDGQEPI